MKGDQAGRELLVTLKTTAGAPGPALCIPVNFPPQAFLRPVATRAELLNAEDVRRLTNWRNRFVRSFQTEFEATETQTVHWLTEVVGPNDKKILFMVDDIYGHAFGHMGLDFIDWAENSGEVDAVVRGEVAPPGIMSLALRTMLAWARGQLGLCSFKVRVRSDNTALGFYRKLGFHEVKRVPLRKVKEKNRLCWVEDSSLQPAELSLVHMMLLNEAGT